MSSQTPEPIAFSPAPRPARLRRQARRRRRRIAAGVALAALLIVAGVVVLNRDDSDQDGTTRTAANGTTSTTGQTDSSTSTTAGETSPPTTGTNGTTPSKKVPLALPNADLNDPPDPPVGLYREGKLRLVGSVPSAATAIRYLNRTRKVLGRANVTMAMQRDPRVPASPMRIIVEEQFRFPSGSFRVDPKYNSLLDLGVAALKALPEARLVVTGYTDNRGSPDINQSLSEERAQVVVDWMVRGGIPERRVTALGRGSANPIASNATEAGRQKNRRIEATLEDIRPS